MHEWLSKVGNFFSFNGFWAASSDNLGSLITGILVFISCAVITFFYKEFLKKPPTFSGVFYLKLKTTDSARNPYKGIESYYVMTLLNESETRSSGRIEKTHDIENNGHKRNYIGRDRNIGLATLNIKNNYFRPSKLYIKLELEGDENRAQRASSIIINLNRVKKRTNGNFFSTAADSSGEAYLQQERF